MGCSNIRCSLFFLFFTFRCVWCYCCRLWFCSFVFCVLLAVCLDQRSILIYIIIVWFRLTIRIEHHFSSVSFKLYPSPALARLVCRCRIVLSLQHRIWKMLKPNRFECLYRSVLFWNVKSYLAGISGRLIRVGRIGIHGIDIIARYKLSLTVFNSIVFVYITHRTHFILSIHAVGFKSFCYRFIFRRIFQIKKLSEWELCFYCFWVCLSL